MNCWLSLRACSCPNRPALQPRARKRALTLLEQQGALVGSGLREGLETKHPQDRHEGTPEDLRVIGIHIDQEAN